MFLSVPISPLAGILQQSKINLSSWEQYATERLCMALQGLSFLPRPVHAKEGSSTSRVYVVLDAWKDFYTLMVKGRNCQALGLFMQYPPTNRSLAVRRQTLKKHAIVPSHEQKPSCSTPNTQKARDSPERASSSSSMSGGISGLRMVSGCLGDFGC